METITHFENYSICQNGAIITNKTLRVRKPTRNKQTGYLQVGLSNGEVRKMFSVHRLVASAFVKNEKPNEYDVVNHIDGNKLNNNDCNLEWTNKSGNEKHANRIGIKINALRKLNAEQVIQLRYLCSLNTASRVSIAHKFGISPASLRGIVNRKTYTSIK